MKQYRNKPLRNIVLVKSEVEKRIRIVVLISNRTKPNQPTIKKQNQIQKYPFCPKEHSYIEQILLSPLSTLTSFMTKPFKAQRALFHKQMNICFEQRNITSLPYMANSYNHMLKVTAACILPKAVL